MKGIFSKQYYFMLIIISLGCYAMPAHSTVFTYSGNGSVNEVMNRYSVSWKKSNSTLSIFSSWADQYSNKIDQVSFLINDGGAPNATSYKEQFLYYDLDLFNNIVQVREYYGDGVLGTYKGLINSTSNSLDLSFDNNLLGLDENSFSHQGRTFEPQLFGEKIGIWHYLYTDNVQVDTYDVQIADTVKVDLPITQTWILLGLGLLIMNLSKRHQSMYNEV